MSDARALHLATERLPGLWAQVGERNGNTAFASSIEIGAIPVDEFTYECLIIRVSRKLKSIDVIDVLSVLRGMPEHIRSDNGPEFIAKAVQTWISAVGARTAYIAPGSTWEKGSLKSFNTRFRDELLNGEIFHSIGEAEIIIESWRRRCNAIRPHASLGYRPPAPEVVVSTYADWPAAPTRPPSPAELPVAQRPTAHQHLLWTTQ